MVTISKMGLRIGAHLSVIIQAFLVHVDLNSELQPREIFNCCVVLRVAFMPLLYPGLTFDHVVEVPSEL